MLNGVRLNLRQSVVDRANGMIAVTIEGDDIPEVKLRGTARKPGAIPVDIDGYVFTPVPADFWNEWLKRNANSSLIRDGFIKAAKTLDAARHIAREHEDAPSMFAPIVVGDTDKADRYRSQDERVNRGLGLGVKKHSTDD